VTPGARVAAAIAILDRILAGDPAERVLIQWARDNRYAGSGDRAAVRDHVFDALRRRRSAAAAGGAETGRGVMFGAIRLGGGEPDSLFTGQGHAPAPLSAAERLGPGPALLPDAVVHDVPDWLWPVVTADLGADAGPALMALRDRAPVHLRVNTARIDRTGAQAALAAEGIRTSLHPEVKTALQVIENERKISASRAYRDGLVELQDAASQAAVLRLPLVDGDRVLDYCAGGGGKALAIAARARVTVIAHDADQARMSDLPARAARAGVAISRAATADLPGLAPFDLVLVDAPCSGSGTWRRNPDAKWRFSPGDLDRLTALQQGILAAAAPLVRPGGVLVYATCAILTAENRRQMDRFLAGAAGWTMVDEMHLLPGLLQDGFYLGVLRRQ
jgi:16S rRNA (cytosine967-C5)-methyltransferase